MLINVTLTPIIVTPIIHVGEGVTIKELAERVKEVVV